MRNLAEESPRQVDPDGLRYLLDDSMESKPRLSAHQSQYDDETARFFAAFNHETGRESLYGGYALGKLPVLSDPAEVIEIADFGCGTGWLTRTMATNNERAIVYGLDSSSAMLTLAYALTAKELMNDGRIFYGKNLPEDRLGKISFVTAIHIHYHFETPEELKKDFFGKIASLLKVGGQVVLIGCPSNYLHTPPNHYDNLVNPKDILHGWDNPPDFLLDQDGRVPLSNAPGPISMAPGTRMKAVFTRPFPSSPMIPKQKRIDDTYWPDDYLIEVAAMSGLIFKQKTFLPSGGSAHAYMGMTFQKRGREAPCFD